MSTRATWLLLATLVLGATATVGWWSLRPGQPEVDSPAPSVPNAPRDLPGPFSFEDVTSSARITFRHEDGATDMHYLPEVMGGGAAWLDFDRDGFLDLFLVQGGPFPADPQATPTGPTSRLYRNRGDGTFTDVTADVGIVMPGYGQGVAVGDYDHDGFTDLFVSHFDGGRLFHNEGNGTGRRFRDVTREAGLVLDGWCTSCAFGDVHGKGHLDLFVCRYLALDPKNYPSCIEKGKSGDVRAACGPHHFAGTRSYLFRNNGDGKFTDVSDSAGIEAGGKGLGVVILDLDGDGRSDIFVGNDEVLNHHYVNLGNGKFRSAGLLSGTGATRHGRPMGSMGIEAGDMTGSGLPDLFVTTYIHEGTVLFRNRGKGVFTDISTGAGMFVPSWNKVGWGTALFDPDHDGNLDLFVANGHTRRNAADLVHREDGNPQEYAQLAQLFVGDGKGRFSEVSPSAGAYFRVPRVGRGVALGDYDNDGRADLAITHVGETPTLLRNATNTPNHWIRLELEGGRHRDPAGSNRDAVGAIITLRVAGRTLVRHLKGGGSYYSAHEPRLLIGLGTADRVDEVVVRWPNAAGTVQKFGPLTANRSYKLTEGIAEAERANCPPTQPTR